MVRRSEVSAVACCSQLRLSWPFPDPLPDVFFASCRLDARQWGPHAAECAGIAEDAALLASVPKRRAEYLAGRLCARHALHALMPERPASVDIGRHPDGGPVWPDGVVGAITHAGCWAAAIVGPAERWWGMGVDVETLFSVALAEELAPFILTPRELALLPFCRQPLEMTLCFSLKESVMKSFLPRIGGALEFRDVEVTDLSPGRARLRVTDERVCGWGASSVEAMWFEWGESVFTLCAIPR
ncbi:MAG: 4'-phosphopantetheinyl transferase superfamily protein [Pseudomonadota bacterium]